MFPRALVASICLTLASTVVAQQQGIPDFGEANAVPLSQEYLMGRTC